MIDKELLDILACPSCHKPVELVQGESDENVQARLVCTGCGLRYPVKNDIPVMLIDEAEPPADAAGTK